MHRGKFAHSLRAENIVENCYSVVFIYSVHKIFLHNFRLCLLVVYV